MGYTTQPHDRLHAWLFLFWTHTRTLTVYLPHQPATKSKDQTADWQSLYVAHEKIHPRETKDLYQTLRNTCVYLLLSLYYSLPWLQWNHHQAVLFDLPARKFYIFNITFWPQDFFYLAWLLIIAGLTLFSVTAPAGRIWRVYTCPQTA